MAGTRGEPRKFWHRSQLGPGLGVIVGNDHTNGGIAESMTSSRYAGGEPCRIMA